MKAFLIRRWFLIALAMALSLGIGGSQWLRPLAATPILRQGIVLAVMFLMSFPLRAVAISSTLRRPGAFLLASAINYSLVPLLAWAICLALGAWSGFSQDMGFGILVAATTPCTLASAAVWTRRAGGNDAVAVMVTMLTNLLCFLVTPGWLWLTMGRVPDFDPLQMVTKLGLLIVLPMFSAQVLRRSLGLGAWATEHKTPIGVLAQCGVLAMIFLGAIQTGNRLTQTKISMLWLNVAVMIVVVLAVHALILFTALRIARRLGFDRRDTIAIGIAGSQKTAMVGLEVSAQLGVTMLPMVTYHVGQLLIDTVVADSLRKDAANRDVCPG
ncbi:MAG: bile acid:sodium symporter [Planctomycetes bacterium]|nr:bile acid:sodium symporter [Planctomycetota bacterium]